MYYRSGTSNVFYSGDSYHSLAEQRAFSFDVLATINGPTGVAAIKFSGDSGISTFKFDKGKIYDPENRYVSSYRHGEQFSLSGNMSGTYYDYYINKSPVCFSGTKSNYKLQKFYIGTTGSEFVTNRIAFYSPPFGHKLSVGKTFLRSGKLTGKLESTGDYSTSKFEIFSGIIKNNELFEVSGIETGMRTSSLITIATTGTTQAHLDSGAGHYESFYLSLELYTNFGRLTQRAEVQCLPIESSFITSGVSDSSSNNFLFSGTGEQIQTGIYSLFYRVAENYRTNIDDIPLKISLDYASGDTGNFYSFSGDSYTGSTGYLNLNSSGSNYSSVPSVVFTGDGLKMSPVATPLMSLKLTGIDVTYSGSGYSGTPTISVSGGTPLTTAAATADTNITGWPYSGMVTGTAITNSGIGYDTIPSIIFSGVLYTGGIQASGGALMGLGQVTGLILNNPGGYLGHRPGLSGITGGGSSGVLSSISVTSSGSGYISSPTILFSGANRITEAIATGLIVTTGAYSGLVTGIHIADRGYGYESTPSISFTGSLYAGGYNATGTAVMRNTVANATGFSISGYTRSFTEFWSIKTGESITGGLVDYTNQNYLTGYQSGQRIGYMDTGHTNVTGENYVAVLGTSGRYNDSGAMYSNLNFHIYSGKIMTFNITGIR